MSTKSGEPSPGPGTPVLSNSGSSGSEFVLDAGVEHDVCGIGVLVTFIPPSGSAGAHDEAMLVGGPVSQVPGVPGGQTGDQPLPGNVAPARPGLTVTVYGKRFSVLSVDTARAQVRLRALC